MDYYFPFGQKVSRLIQKEQTPKMLFVLGVYASAVHARWVHNYTTICQALAVASEPCIFWNGNIDEAKSIINRISIPSKAGVLLPSNEIYNGPSGRSLDLDILYHLNATRKDAWLCDLLPEARLNNNQQTAIERHYNPLIWKYNLNTVSVPFVNRYYCDDFRRSEITNEIVKSKADYLVLLGDIPIEQYIKHVAYFPFKNLSDYSIKRGYGNPYIISINEKKIKVLPIAHPRQISKLGRSSAKWYVEHVKWKLSIK